METTILHTQPLVDALIPQVKSAVAALPAAPTLAVVLVGDDPASIIYVNKKKEAIENLGGNCCVHHLGRGTTQELLESTLRTLNEDSSIHGVLLQVPLPKMLNASRALNIIHPSKDVDGLTETSWKNMEQQANHIFYPATPLGVMRLLQWIQVKLEHKKTVVVGRSRLVGKPLTEMLRQQNTEITTFSKEHPIQQGIIKDADIIISAAGCAGLITGDMIKQGAVVIDIGVNAVNSHTKKRKVVGDVIQAEAIGKASYLTPVPGGVGRLTVISLITNLVEAAAIQQSRPPPTWEIPTFNT